MSCLLLKHAANLHSCKRLIRCHPWLDMIFERKCRSIDQQQARNRNRVDMTRRTLEPHMTPCGNLSLNRWHQRDMCSWCKHPDAKHHLAVKCFTWLHSFWIVTMTRYSIFPSFLWYLTTIGGRLKPDLCFLSGRLRRTVLPKERYGESLSEWPWIENPNFLREKRTLYHWANRRP